MANNLQEYDVGPIDDTKEEIAQMFETVGNQVRGLNLDVEEDDEGGEGPKIVDEIECLCMNCGENVRQSNNYYFHSNLTDFLRFRV